VLAQLKQEPARLIIRTAYESGRASEWLADRTKIPAVILPFTVGGSDKAKDLFGLFDDTVQRLLGALK
jgi:zinc/manganese transport system substrate-binding protein